MLRTILIVAMIFAAIFGCLCLLASILDFGGSRYADRPKIKFTHFRKWYSISPEAWTLQTYSVEKNDLLEEGEWGIGSSKWINHERATFNFSLIDTLRYVHWRGAKEKSDAKRRENEELARLLDSVHKDLEEYLKT